MRKIFSLILVSLLAFPITACGQNRAGETGTIPGDTGGELEAEEETIVKAVFDFERRTVMLNSVRSGVLCGNTNFSASFVRPTPTPFVELY